jgi:hypothetical protein
MGHICEPVVAVCRFPWGGGHRGRRAEVGVRVRDPAGAEWQVGLHWIGRHLVEAPERVRRRGSRAWAWQRRTLKGGDALNGLGDGLGGLDAEAAIGCLVVIGLLVALLLLLLIGPWLGLLVLGVVELLVLAVLATLAFTWRVVARRPWRVRASGPGGVVVGWRVVGWRRSREVVRDAADAIRRGGDLVYVHTELLERPAA